MSSVTPTVYYFLKSLILRAFFWVSRVTVTNPLKTFRSKELRECVPTWYVGIYININI